MSSKKPLAIVLGLAITLILSSNISFAEDEHVSATPKNETAKIVSIHTPEEEHAQMEEHSSHEGAETVHEIREESEHEHMHETEGSHEHNSATAETTQWVGVGTLLAVVPVYAIRIRSTNKIAYKNAVVTLALGVGIMHVLLSQDHLVDHGIEYGIFFASTGFAQVIFGLLFMAKPTRRLAIIGAAGSIGSIILYFVTPEGVDPVGIIVKIAEMSLVVLLIYLAAYLGKAKPLEAANAGLNRLYASSPFNA